MKANFTVKELHPFSWIVKCETLPIFFSFSHPFISDDCVTCALSLRCICYVDFFVYSCRAGAFKQTTVTGILRCCWLFWKDSGLKVSPIVVPVLSIYLHGLNVESSRGINQLSHASRIPMVGFPESILLIVKTVFFTFILISGFVFTWIHLHCPQRKTEK